MMTMAVGLCCYEERLEGLERWLEMAPEYLRWTRFWDETYYRVEGLRVICIYRASS